MITISLLGAGVLSQHLYYALLENSQCELVQWYARKPDQIAAFRETVTTTDRIEDLLPADIYILAISDDAISSFSNSLPVLKGLLVHTSGAINMHQLPKRFRRGVFYPLQTFSADRPLCFSEIPICIEAENKEDLTKLKQLAQILGCKTYKMSSTSRSHIHLAAVFVNNFVNQLYRIGHEITESQGVNFDILKPLITETAAKVQEQSPYRSQTGPAMRSDIKSIKNHLKLLEDNPSKQELYQLLTKSIAKTHGKKL